MYMYFMYCKVLTKYPWVILACFEIQDGEWFT